MSSASSRDEFVCVCLQKDYRELLMPQIGEWGRENSKNDAEARDLRGPSCSYLFEGGWRMRGGGGRGEVWPIFQRTRGLLLDHRLHPLRLDGPINHIHHLAAWRGVAG